MSFEASQRAVIVAEARKWIGTPYHSCADVRGAGVDCGMILVRIFVDLGLCEPLDPRPYAEDWHLHRGEEKYLEFVEARFKQASNPRPGDIVVFRYGRCYSHGALVTKSDPLTILHAFQPAAVVLEEELVRNVQLADPARRRRYFSLWAEEGG